MNNLLRILTVLVAFIAVTARPAPAQNRAQSPSLTLQMVLERVSTSHPVVEAASARARAARGARMTSGAFGNPVVSYDYEGGTTERQTGTGTLMPGMERETMITAALPLAPLYQRGSRVRRADSEIRAADADVIAERQRILLGAARTFYHAALAQVELEVARDLGVWLDTIVAYNTIRAEEGVAAEADLLRSALERDRASAEAAQREAELARARSEVGAFLGDVSFVVKDVALAIDDGPMPMPDTSMMPAIAPLLMQRSLAAGRVNAADESWRPLINGALDGRAEIRAARERLAAAGAGISTQRSMIVRDLQATIGTKRSDAGSALLAGLSIPFPLMDSNRGEITRATAERDVAAFELEAKERAVSAEIVGAFEAARVLTERVGAMARSGPTSYLARADEARRIALGAYQEGAVPLTQVIDAARTWGEARVGFYRTVVAQHESVLMLLVAQGIDLTARSTSARTQAR